MGRRCKSNKIVNRSIILVISAALLFAPQFALADREIARSSAVQQLADSDWEFKQLTLEYLRARSPGSRKFEFETVQRYYATNAGFSGNGLPLQNIDLVGWQRYRDEFAKDMSNFSQLTILPRNDDFKVLRHGDTVSTRISFREVGRLADGRRIDQTSNVQLEWKKVSGLWVIGREQKSPPAEAESTALAERVVR
jgi:hypothetical protein